MNLLTRRILFLLFFVSGFSGLVYQIVWTRLAFATFGIIAPVLSVVLSVFMLGLSVGSWAGGRYVALWVRKTGLSAVALYAGAELVIGLGAFSVPALFSAGGHFLLVAGQTNSGAYLSLSALALGVSIFPWCVFMGATFPVMMAYVRECDPRSTESFSFLYLANVLGAMSGTLLTAVVLVELLGFRHTLWVAAAGNFSIAIISGWLAWQRSKIQPQRSGLQTPQSNLATSEHGTLPPGPHPGRLIEWILFSTGFCAMAMEVVWARAFTPVLSTQVYSFAMVVFAYLGATFTGSLLYRRNLQKRRIRSTAELISALCVSAFLPIVANDPRFVQMDNSIDFLSVVVLLGSICPLCAVLGYLTPKLVDEYAAGNPASAGRAYAINVLGCILGPLFASYVLLPSVSERHALGLLALPFVIFFAPCFRSLSARHRTVSGLLVSALLVGSLTLSKDFEQRVSEVTTQMEVRRDYAASVIAAKDENSKGLFVNGVSMTSLTPVTKFMVHLPLAFHRGQSTSALIICFGMGTTHRSALSWNVETTTVELVPSVEKSFPFFHADAKDVLANPKGRIVIDDGRRYLKRTKDKFDVIVIDPPPPVQAAGSSLLYTEEFYELAKQHLKPHGILQAWTPGGNPNTAEAVLRSVCNSFSYVRCFPSVERWGMHILASMQPIETVDAEAVAARFPEAARRDLLEWNSTGESAASYINSVLTQEFSLAGFLATASKSRITDDQPYNEYFLLREFVLGPQDAVIILPKK